MIPAQLWAYRTDNLKKTCREEIIAYFYVVWHRLQIKQKVGEGYTGI
jgi:hypothetical protein